VKEKSTKQWKGGWVQEPLEREALAGPRGLKGFSDIVTGLLGWELWEKPGSKQIRPDKEVQQRNPRYWFMLSPIHRAYGSLVSMIVL